MNYSTDRDLLAHEPNLFTDLTWVSQERLNLEDVTVSGTTATTAAGDFAAAGVEAGGVVLIDGVPHEVVGRDADDTLTVSLLRADLGESARPGAQGGPFTLVARTFAPQAAMVRGGLLRLLGIDPSDPAEDDAALTEDAVVSLSVMARLEALGTLERVYSGASALSGDNTLWQYKAGEYRRRFRAAISKASVLIDTNDDGVADERRHLGVVRYRRS